MRGRHGAATALSRLPRHPGDYLASGTVDQLGGDEEQSVSLLEESMALLSDDESIEQQEDDAIGLTRFASWCMPSRNAWRKTLIFFLTFVSASLLLLLSEINNYNINVSFVSSYAYGIFQRCHITFNLIRMAKANMKKEDSLEAST